MRHLRNVALVAFGWSLLACDLVEPSDENQYWLKVGLEDQLGSHSRRVLVGSEFELRIEDVIPEGEIDPNGGGLACVISSASGSLVELPGTSTPTYSVQSAGPGAVEFTAPSDSCPANEDVLSELGPDRWSMTGVEASAAIAKWVPDGDAALLVYDMHPGRAGAFPDAIGRPLEEARVAGDGWFVLHPVLIEPSVGERAEVRWHDPDAFITVPAHYQEVATYVDDDGERRPQRYLSGSVRAGTSFDSSVTILGHELELPTLTAVPTQEISSLELVPAYYPSEESEREWGLPGGVVAIARDREGRRIVGMPIEWSITRGRVAHGSDNFGYDVLELADCRDEPRKPQWRSATIEAKLDDLVASVDLEWIALPSDQIDPTSAPCHGSACDCSTTASPRDSVFAALALLGLGGLLRRRPERDPTPR